MAKKKIDENIYNTEVDRLMAEYRLDKDNMQPIRELFDDFEKVLMGKPINDKYSFIDPTLQTAIIKQNNMLVSQLPRGRVTASKKYRGQAKVIDLILNKYIIPNANTTYDVFTKWWLTSLYRKIYGAFGVMTTYVVKKDYVGPDFTLIPARALILQSGRYTIDDSDYVYVRSLVTRDWLKSKRKKKDWKNIDEVLEKVKGNNKDSEMSTTNENIYTPSETKQIELVTKYTEDKWITFNPDTKLIVREIDGYGFIPVDICYSYPLLDRVIGLGEAERGMNLHESQNKLTSLYFKAVEMSIAPPIKIDLSSVVPKTIVNKPAAKWVIRNGQMNGVQEVNRSPLGLTTFNATYSFLKAGVLSLTNTTDTSISQETDPGFGKTPQALKMQQATEAIKTSFDRIMLEKTITSVYEKMINLLVKKQPKPIKLEVFEEEIEEIAKEYPDVLEMYNPDTGELIIKKEDVDVTRYKFDIDPNSTVLKNNVAQHEILNALIDKLIKLPTIQEQIAKTGEAMLGDKKVVFSELVKEWLKTSGVDNIDKILVPNDREAEQPQEVEAIQREQGSQAQQQIPPEAMMAQQQMVTQQPMPQPPVNFEEDPELQDILQQLGGGR